jgi:hypothetical protein
MSAKLSRSHLEISNSLPLDLLTLTSNLVKPEKVVSNLDFRVNHSSGWFT